MPNRRSFLKAAASMVAFQRVASPQTPPAASQLPVLLIGDGVHLTTPQYAELLATLTAGGAKIDSYLAGGRVEELESPFADLLGKEGAMFLPAGTRATHRAVRQLAGGRRHVLV